MTLKKRAPEPFDDFTEDQLANLEKSINTLDQEDKKWEQEQRDAEAEEKIKSRDLPLSRLKKPPLEIINRLLFFFFLGSFFFSFVSVYVTSIWWFFAYVLSAFSCILYLPNRKALKELIAAWPNIEDLIKKRSLWRK